MADFQLKSDMRPTGDQPTAIAALVDGLRAGDRMQTLLGVTGSGKTFTMANVIAQMQRPTLILEPNKTLAAQICSEMREFFPDNAVEFFVSYYDYYQPEAYIPGKDMYIEKDALILGNPLPHAVPDAVNAHLTLTAGRLGLLPALAAAAEAAQTEVKIQIKIDTGLHRVGVTPGDELEALLKELSAAGERIKLAGVYSHFADTAKPELCRTQAELLLRSAEQVERAGFAVPMRHICDSAGSEYYPEYHFDAVRLGRRLIMDHPTQPRGNVRECASWRSCIMAVHRRHAGEKLGYGGVYTLDHDADVAIVGVGYGDGLYLPLVEMHGDILVRGERRPLLACCMDQCMVDVTGMEVQIGEEVTLFGFDREGNALLSQDVANFCGANEGCALTSALSPRVERIIEN